MDQHDLVARAKKGDHDAFATLAGAAVARLDAAARLILRDPELARDAVQDGFIRAWRTLPALRDPDRFDAWLRRLVVHSCIDMLRKRRRSAARPSRISRRRSSIEISWTRRSGTSIPSGVPSS